MDQELSRIVVITMAVYVVVVFAIAYGAGRRIANVEDYVVAGRRLSFSLAAPTLFATWFGAGTLLTATDEVRARGLVAAALDPLGAGICLLIAGLLLARPLWEMKLTTLPDFYRRKFGARAEKLSAALMVPSYFGWIAAQFIALAQMLELFAGIPLTTGLALVAAVGVGYTLLGGMWAVTLTDALQMTFTVVGLLVLATVVLSGIGGDVMSGIARVWSDTPSERRTLVDTETFARFTGWMGVLAAGALGNLPMQDLTQRIFAARSATVAQRACLAAGVAYLAFGVIPVFLGLAAATVDGHGRSTVAWLAGHFFSPTLAVVFVVVIMSVVLSTIDSAILAPATVLAQNLIMPHFRAVSPLLINRLAVLLVGSFSLGFAYLGESAYSLLESAYELGMVSLLVPLIFGLSKRIPATEQGALAAMVSGFGLWLLHAVAGWESFCNIDGVTIGLSCTAVSLIAYALAGAWSRRTTSGLVQATTIEREPS